MHCTIFFHGADNFAMMIAEYLYQHGFTLETSKISYSMAGCISFQIPDSPDNRELLKVLINRVNEDIEAQLILGKRFGGTNNSILNNNFKKEIRNRVKAGTLPLNPQIR